MNTRDRVAGLLRQWWQQFWLREAQIHEAWATKLGPRDPRFVSAQNLMRQAVVWAQGGPRAEG